MYRYYLLTSSLAVLARRASVFHLPVRAGVAVRAVVFPLPMRAGVAVRAAVFQLAMRAGVAVRALAFQPAMRAGVALRAVAFPLAMRASFSSPHHCVPATRVPGDPRGATASSPGARRNINERSLEASVDCQVHSFFLQAFPGHETPNSLPFPR